MPKKPSPEAEFYNWMADGDANFNAWLRSRPLSRVVEKRMEKLAGAVSSRRRRRDAETQILDEIMREEWEVYARDVSMDMGRIEQIGPQLFLGLTLDSKRDAVLDDRGFVLRDVRLMSPAQAEIARSEKPSPSKQRTRSGPKSQETWIRLAIEKVPPRYPRWPGFNLARRVAAYLDFLNRETEADTDERGFSAKTFEKFENEVRKETRR